MGLRKFLDMIRGKEKSQGDTENPLVPITKLPLLVVSYIWIVLLSQIMSQYWCIAINKSPYFIHILLVVCVCVFLTRHKIPCRSYICFVSWGSSWLWQFLRLSLSGWFWESWRVLIRNVVDTSVWICWCFPHDWTGVIGLGSKATEVKSQSHHIKSRIPAINMMSLLLLTLTTWWR